MNYRVIWTFDSISPILPLRKKSLCYRYDDISFLRTVPVKIDGIIDFNFETIPVLLDLFHF